ncbi:MAG TPA: type IV pilus assembly protein PilM [Actinomycetota bacterium]|nr:type IV pilus assembly protein PilM [Actinomycetota bacterium]
MARAREAVGLDIGTSGVRAAHVSFAKHPYTLENFGQVSLPQGAVRDGEIVDSAVVAQALTELWKRAGFKKKAVSLGIANQKVIGRAIDLPYMQEAELRGAIQFQVQEYIPIPVDDAVIDFQILDEFVTENNERMVRLFLVAAQKDMVAEIVETVSRAGLSPEAIDFIPLALIRSLGETSDSLARPTGEGEAVIDIGAGVTNIVVHEGGVPRFTRVLSIGGNNLTEALSAGLGVSFEDAESIKQRLGLSGAAPGAPAPVAPGEAEPPVQSGDMAARILEQRAGALVDEIRGSLDYYMAGGEATRISRVILSGGASKLPNLALRLANALRLPVEQGRTLRKIKMGKVGLSDAQVAEAEPLMSAAVGIAMGVGQE